MNWLSSAETAILWLLVIVPLAGMSWRGTLRQRLRRSVGGCLIMIALLLAVDATRVVCSAWWAKQKALTPSTSRDSGTEVIEPMSRERL